MGFGATDGDSGLGDVVLSLRMPSLFLRMLEPEVSAALTSCRRSLQSLSIDPYTRFSLDSLQAQLLVIADQLGFTPPPPPQRTDDADYETSEAIAVRLGERLRQLALMDGIGREDLERGRLALILLREWQRGCGDEDELMTRRPGLACHLPDPMDLGRPPLPTIAEPTGTQPRMNRWVRQLPLRPDGTPDNGDVGRVRAGLAALVSHLHGGLIRGVNTLIGSLHGLLRSLHTSLLRSINGVLGLLLIRLDPSLAPPPSVSISPQPSDEHRTQGLGQAQGMMRSSSAQPRRTQPAEPPLNSLDPRPKSGPGLTSSKPPPQATPPADTGGSTASAPLPNAAPVIAPASKPISAPQLTAPKSNPTDDAATTSPEPSNETPSPTAFNFIPGSDTDFSS